MTVLVKLKVVNLHVVPFHRSKGMLCSSSAWSYFEGGGCVCGDMHVGVRDLGGLCVVGWDTYTTVCFTALYIVIPYSG